MNSMQNQNKKVFSDQSQVAVVIPTIPEDSGEGGILLIDLTNIKE